MNDDQVEPLEPAFGGTHTPRLDLHELRVWKHGMVHDEYVRFIVLCSGPGGAQAFNMVWIMDMNAKHISLLICAYALRARKYIMNSPGYDPRHADMKTLGYIGLQSVMDVVTGNGKYLESYLATSCALQFWGMHCH